MIPEIQIVPDAEALFRAGAAEFVRLAGEAIMTQGSFTVALSGGSTPKDLYGLLATDPRLRGQVPWDKIHVFWGDERHVPPTDAESNDRMAHEALPLKAVLDGPYEPEQLPAPLIRPEHGRLL
jgi:6-phosphogluconolactonase